MKYAIKCAICGDVTWIHGNYEPDTNATCLDDNDRGWNEACEHLKAGGVHAIIDEEFIEDESYERTDHGDSVWPY